MGGLSWAPAHPRTLGCAGSRAAGKGSPRRAPTCSRPEAWSRGPAVGAGRPPRRRRGWLSGSQTLEPARAPPLARGGAGIGGETPALKSGGVEGAGCDLRALGLRPRAGPSSPGEGVALPSRTGLGRAGAGGGLSAGSARRREDGGCFRPGLLSRPEDPAAPPRGRRGSPRRRGPVPCLRPSASSPHTCSQEAPRIARAVPAPDAAAPFLPVGSAGVSEGLPSPSQVPPGKRLFHFLYARAVIPAPISRLCI